MLPYGQVNVELFQKIKKKILEEPRRFDMGQWGRQGQDEMFKLQDPPPCGTVACIAGWALAIDHLEKGGTLERCNFINPLKACRLLGIPEDIFYVFGWPISFRNKYMHEQYNAAGRARVAAEFIDYICGVENE